MKDEKRYRVATDADLTALSYDPRYTDAMATLVGPDDWHCVLGEPEDRIWCRDGQAVIDHLNQLDEEVRRLRAALVEIVLDDAHIGIGDPRYDAGYTDGVNAMQAVAEIALGLPLRPSGQPLSDEDRKRLGITATPGAARGDDTASTPTVTAERSGLSQEDDHG